MCMPLLTIYYKSLSLCFHSSHLSNFTDQLLSSIRLNTFMAQTSIVSMNSSQYTNNAPQTYCFFIRCKNKGQVIIFVSNVIAFLWFFLQLAFKHDLPFYATYSLCLLNFKYCWANTMTLQSPSDMDCNDGLSQLEIAALKKDG